MIYDAEPKYPTGFDAGRSVVMPFLEGQGIQQIDVMMISHGDNDHIGGSGWLLANYWVKNIMTSVPQSHWGRPVIACYAGESWRWDGVDFHVLSPAQGKPYEDNNSSCVLRIQTGHRQILLTGDIEKPIERGLLVHEKKALAATLLVVPHHGSHSSSTLAFLKVVHPRYALISVGYQNRYHFPAKAVLERYQRIGAHIFTTSKQGAIQVHLPSVGPIHISIAYHRHHYWQNLSISSEISL